MKKEHKKKQDASIDEAYLMSLMADGVKKHAQQGAQQEQATDSVQEQPGEKPVAKKRPRSKRVSDMGYGERFLSRTTMARRGDKCIYIRQEYHQRLSRIAQVVGEDKTPLYAYLDNILKHHFEQFEKAITEDFNEQFKPLF